MNLFVPLPAVLAGCWCDLIVHTASKFALDIHHVKSLAGRKPCGDILDEDLWAISASLICTEWWGPLIGKRASEVFGHVVDLPIEASDKQVLLTGKAQDIGIPVHDKTEYFLAQNIGCSLSTVKR